MKDSTKSLIAAYGEDVFIQRPGGAISETVKILEIGSPFEGQAAYDSVLRVGDIILSVQNSWVALVLAIKPVVMAGNTIRYDCTFFPCAAGIQIQRSGITRNDLTMELETTWPTIFEVYYATEASMDKLRGVAQAGMANRATIIIPEPGSESVGIGDRVAFVGKGTATGTASLQGSTLLGTGTLFEDELEVGQWLYSGPDFIGVVDEITSNLTAILSGTTVGVVASMIWFFAETGEVNQVDSLERLDPGAKYGCLRLSLIEDVRE